jgi:hypothetical protein
MSDEWEKVESEKIFWTPLNKGDEIRGKVTEISQGMYGARYTIKTDKGDICTNSHKVLQARMQGVVVGEEIKIIYQGEIPPKQRGENPTKIYDVFRRKTDTAVVNS